MRCFLTLFLKSMKKDNYRTFIHTTEYSVYITLYFDANFIETLRTFNTFKEFYWNYALGFY